MNISAVNCTPIKPQVAFKSKEEILDQDFINLMEKTDKFNDEYINSSSIKKPFAIIGSIALAGITAFAFGSKIVSYARRFLPDITNPESSKYFETFIKKGAQKVNDFATDLQSETGKAPKVKKAIGMAIEATSNFAKNAYKKITNIGVKNVPQNPGDIAGKKLENLGGAIAAATFVPGAANTDTNGDGISDLCQKDVNAYTGGTYNSTKEKIGKTIEGVGVIENLISVFS